MALKLADKPAEEKKEGDVEGRIGFGSGFRNVQGGNQYGFNRGASGFNQGSGGFDAVNRYNNVQGFRNRDGYRTNAGFDQSDFNRYGSGGGGFSGGFNRGAGGVYNQHGQAGGFYG
ncbi:glycine proline-rich secreted protein, putative [Ixodes scapularis]|uniref:Glycine proline-rich secreted protein, putative n=1 Tax=Ixodes scapularis TaxID=6945 RepID=B7Q6J2_IXOSC|nr:glycine proline-rich secreted protein, putative [Ixodes scapularis]|eukprot:XP_002411975.1 glycine proline-rich secreted protein, putative [Ixodes scapularis]